MPKSVNNTNINYSDIKHINSVQALWGYLMVEELIRNGVTLFCISPGSRSTPLTLAVAAHPQARHMMHFDERGSAFFALGYASTKKGGVAIITTSGTAAANVLPAVIEASKKKLPLVVLTADRPPELRFTGAHQTIDQVNLFGKYVRFAMDIPTPSLAIAPEFVLTTVDQAVFRAQGELPGPVHLNCMYREPFFLAEQAAALSQLKRSIRDWYQTDEPYTEYSKSQSIMSSRQIQSLVKTLEVAQNGVIVVGKLPDDKCRKAVLRLANKLKWPVFTDLSSGLRLGNNTPELIHFFNQLLSKHKPQFDCVLQLGGRITAKNWQTWQSQHQINRYIMILNHPLRNDPLHNVTHRIHGRIDEICQKLSLKIKMRKPSAELKLLKPKNEKVAKAVDQICAESNQLTEPAVCHSISKLIPKSHALFLSNSLPLREFEGYASIHGAAVPIGANRGASGIDGIISSASGFSYGLKRRTTLLIGDLACLYDLNALAYLKQLSQPMSIVVLNNDGGGIFSFLPIAQSSRHFDEFFGTPHGLSFEGAAQQFGLNYQRPQTLSEFDGMYQYSLKQSKSTLIEVSTQRPANFDYQTKLCRQLQVLIA